MLSVVFVIINIVPRLIKIIASPFVKVNVSCKKITAKIIVRTVLDLSIETTLLTLPSCKARK